MNNGIPFFNPYNNFQVPNNINNHINRDDYERLTNKIERLEKNIRIIDNRLKKLEKTNNNNDYFNDEPTDMYIL